MHLCSWQPVGWTVKAAGFAILLGAAGVATRNLLLTGETTNAQPNRAPSDLVSDLQNFRPVRVVPQQKPITDVPILSAEDIGGRVTAKELVLGVTVNGESRAYPINMLTGPSREIINDTLAGRPIAATW